MVFSQSRDRPGNDQDIKTIQKTFEKSQVRIHENKTCSEMEIELIRMRRNEQKFDFLIVFVLAHGFKNANGAEFIKDRLNEDVPMEIFESFIRSNESLNEKPKVLFVQACRRNQNCDDFEASFRPKLMIRGNCLSEKAHK